MDGLEGLDRQNIEVVESFARDGGAEPMFYDADLEVFDQEEEPLKVSPYMLKSFQFIKDKSTGLYGCQFCGYRSMHRSSIKSHLAVHSSARPFACGMCSYDAKRLNDLRKHWLIKHGKRLATRSRGYRHRATMGGHKSNNRPNSGNEQNASNHGHIDLSVSMADGSASQWHSSGVTVHTGTSSDSMVNMCHPQPSGTKWHSPLSGSMRNMVAISPDSEDADIELVDANEEDFDQSNSDILSRSGDDDNIIIKTESPHDDFITVSNDEHNRQNNMEVSDKNTDETIAISDSTKNDDDIKNLNVEPVGTISSASQSTSAAFQSKSSETYAQTINKTSTQSHHFATNIYSNQADTMTNNFDLNKASASRPSQASMHQHNTFGSAMDPHLKVTANNPSAMTQPNQNTSIQGRVQITYENQSVNVIKTPSSRLRSTLSTDSINSAAVTSSAANLRHANVGTSRGWMCNYCQIQFFDNAIYFMHMGLHEKDDPWKCTVCGKRLYDVYSFTSHFVNGHSSAS